MNATAPAPLDVISLAPGSLRGGPAFGGRDGYFRTDAAAGLEGLYVARTGRWYHGRAGLRVDVAGCEVAVEAIAAVPNALVLRRRAPGMEVDQSVRAAASGAAACLEARIRNRSGAAVTVVLRASGRLAAAPSSWHRQQPRQSDIDRRFTPVHGSRERGALLAAGDAGEIAGVWTQIGRRPRLRADGGWTWRASLTLEPGALRVVRLALTVQDAGAAHAPWSELRADEGDPDTVAIAGAPEAAARGVFWGQVNARRVVHAFRGGVAFTNDPPGSTVVTRDVAWFCFGADWFMPETARSILDAVTRHAPYPSGKIAEYMDFNANPVTRADYGLNIADPTPLYLLAIHHHAAVTGDLDWLRQGYPAARAAADYLIAQVRDGLAVCTSRSDAPGSGQCGWRNVMGGVRVTGATPELQAMSAAALRACAAVAGALGQAGDAARWAHHAGDLERALDERLVDPQTGRHRLALDAEDPAYGRDDTLDQVFPLLFGLASPGVARRTTEHVLRPAYRGPGGLRTVPVDSPAYHPTAQWGLVGGVWPNACAWASAAIAPWDPEAAAALAEQIAAALWEPDPGARGFMAPGQFPEWYAGDTGASAGMALSPWMPPTYVWLVIERLLGITPHLHGLEVHPHVPNRWLPAEVRNLAWRGGRIALRIAPGEITATTPLAACDRRVTAVPTLPG